MRNAPIYKWLSFFNSIKIETMFFKFDIFNNGFFNFLMTTQKTFFISVIEDLTDIEKKEVISFCKKTGYSVVIGNVLGQFYLIEKNEYGEVVVNTKSETILFQCKECKNYWFGNNYGSWTCKICGECDGNNHINQMICGHEDMLWSEVL